VLDEKMEDAMKITVIATGFKTEYPQKKERNVAAAALTHARGISVPHSSTHSAHVSAPRLEDIEEAEPVAPAAPSPRASVPRYEVPLTVATSARQETPVEAARAVTARFDENDLDVPAFLRKRGE
jgi:hypothetical protein